MESNLFGEFITYKFSDVWPDYNTFKTSFNNLPKSFQNHIIGKKTSSGITLDTDSLETLYYLIAGQYKNSHIANTDLDQFQALFFNTMYQNTQAYLKKQEIRDNLLALTDDEILAGTTTVFNHAYNPSTEPSTGSTNELDYVNDQNVTKYKKAKVDAYSMYLSEIRSDPTETYLGKFKPLFLMIVEPYNEIIFEN